MPPDSPRQNDGAVEIALPPDPDLTALGVLAQVLHDFGAAAALDEARQQRLHLALDELITNSLSYALPSVPHPDLRLRLRMDHGSVVAQLEDNGKAFNPLTDVPAPDVTLGLAERPVGGLGVWLVKHVADHCVYARIGARNCLTLRFEGGKIEA